MNIKLLELKGKQLRQRISHLAGSEGEGVWRTIRGRHLFIRKGESVQTALEGSLSGSSQGLSYARPKVGETITLKGKKGKITSISRGAVWVSWDSRRSGGPFEDYAGAQIRRRGGQLEIVTE